MHKAFRAIERQKGEDGRAFFARVFKEAGGSGDFHEPWMQMSQVVDEGYESPYVFGRMMRQYLQDEHAVIYRYNPTRIYLAFNGGTDDATRAVLFDPTWRTADEQPAPGVDWFAAVDDLTGLPLPAAPDVIATPDSPHIAYNYIHREMGAMGGAVQKATMIAQEPDEEAEPYICDNCGREIGEAEAYVEEGVLCPDCWLDQQQVN